VTGTSAVLYPRRIVFQYRYGSSSYSSSQSWSRRMCASSSRVVRNARNPFADYETFFPAVSENSMGCSRVASFR
jgi:hypothetical protein